MDDSQPETDVLRIEQRGAVLVITLDRPEARNALDRATADALRHAFSVLDTTPELAVGVVVGAGPGFSAGLDLKAFLEHGLPPELLAVFEQGASKPLVAAVEGFALAGGLELALTCDLIVAAEGARFGIPEVGVGLFAGGGGLFRLSARIGATRALEMALTGAPIDADRAERVGLVTKVVPVGTALDAAIELAERIAGNAPLGVRASKRIIWDTIGRTDVDGWRLQQDLLQTVLASDDAVEGPRAFAAKRRPNWTGHQEEL